MVSTGLLGTAWPCSPSDLGLGLLEQERGKFYCLKPPCLWDVVEASQCTNAGGDPLFLLEGREN